ncbi:NAD(P)/FAD-dependent oxidoreductase [Sphingomonas japonica]|uniref:Flavin-dependent dehydrogenase n=1 Tax=Sphingomonas japonica TaxID=511662 RepID=A0ABX0U056_9SPHN|nr:FAD-dependent monooxygenase [Sphingomonas japonica]NIJ23960.1 flavin-dependent dehydrogenase [Sphingomonas japonica]
MRRADPLILGGGPAGAAAAIRLARVGARPVLLERQRAIGDAICGGFVSWRTLAALEALGVSPDDLNPVPVTHVRIFAAGRHAEARLPAPARGVSRHRLDTLLLAAAQREGAGIELGVRIRALDGDGAHLADGATLAPETIFLATGKHDLRGVARPAHARGRDPTLGIRVRVTPSRAMAQTLAGRIELHCFTGGYAGIVLQEDGTANICMAVHRSRLDAAGDPVRLLQALGTEHPALGDRLAAWDDATPIDAVANVPYGWRACETGAGHYRLGDQAAVIPSLAGEGIGIAIASAAAAVARWRNAGSAGAMGFQARFARDARVPLRNAGLLRTLAEHRVGGALLVRAMDTLPMLADAAARLTRIRAIPIDDSASASHI